MSTFRKLVVRFHTDERGMETIQIIMTLAIAAMVCGGINGVAGLGADGQASNGGLFGGLGGLLEGILPNIGDFLPF